MKFSGGRPIVFMKTDWVGLFWEEGIVTWKIQKYCTAQWYCRRAGSSKAFFVMQCHFNGKRSSGVTRGIHVVSSICVQGVDPSLYTIHLFSPCTSWAGKGYFLASWALTDAKRVAVGVGLWSVEVYSVLIQRWMKVSLGSGKLFVFVLLKSVGSLFLVKLWQ